MQMVECKFYFIEGKRLHGGLMFIMLLQVHIGPFSWAKDLMEKGQQLFCVLPQAEAHAIMQMIRRNNTGSTATAYTKCNVWDAILSMQPW